MSYILDALNKSERERRTGSIETLETVADRQAFSRSRARYAVLGALVLGLCVLVGVVSWYVSDRFSRTTVSTKTALGDRETIDPADPIVDPSVGPDEPPPVVIDSTREVDPAPPKQVAAGSAAVGTKAAQEPASTGGAEAPRIAVSQSELDADTLARIPRLEINVLTYSPEPARRFVMVNGRFAREGEGVGEGVVIEEIQPDRVVVSLGTTRFYLEAH